MIVAVSAKSRHSSFDTFNPLSHFGSLAAATTFTSQDSDDPATNLGHIRPVYLKILKPFRTTDSSLHFEDQIRKWCEALVTRKKMTAAEYDSIFENHWDWPDDKLRVAVAPNATARVLGEFIRSNVKLGSSVVSSFWQGGWDASAGGPHHVFQHEILADWHTSRGQHEALTALAGAV